MNPHNEPFATEFSQRGLVLHELLYSTTYCQVYKIIAQQQHIPAVLKLELHSTSTPALSQREVDNMWRCQHPNIVQLYDCFSFILSSTQWVSALVVEQMTKDVWKEVSDRATNGYPWNEDELMEFLTVMVRALSFAQGLQVAHRDIKPQNIFLRQGVYKLGDFGSSKFIDTLAGFQSLSGTPLYLSPVLRESLFQQRSSAAHNPYKSDVFSLGLTLLHMANLSPVMALTGIETVISRMVESLNYSENLKNYLRWMLVIEEKNRPDFVELQKALEPVDIPLTPKKQEETKDLTTPTVLDIGSAELEIGQRTPERSEFEVRESTLDCIHIQRDPSLPNLPLCCQHAICQNCTKAVFSIFGVKVECSVCQKTQEFVLFNRGMCNRCVTTQNSLIEINAKSIIGRFCLQCIKEMLKSEELATGDVFNALVNDQN